MIFDHKYTPMDDSNQGLGAGALKSRLFQGAGAGKI